VIHLLDGFGREEVKPSDPLSVFMVDVFYYFSDFPDDAVMVGLGVGYDLCSVKVMLCFACKVHICC
jgi:hypothetical protein